MKKYFYTLIYTAVLSLALIPVGVYAQTYTPLEPLPCISNKTAENPGGVDCAAYSSTGGLMTTVEFKNYVQYMFNLIIALAAAAAVFMMVLGGLQYMTTDSWSDKKDGLDKVKNALYGMILILCSYMILRTIDPRLVAIPTTLVPEIPALKNLPKRDNLFDILQNNIDELTKIAAKSDGQAKEIAQKAIDDNKKIQDNVSALLTKVTDLQNQIKTNQNLSTDVTAEKFCEVTEVNPNVPPEVKEMCRKLAEAHGDQKRDEASTIVNNAKVSISQTLQNCLKEVKGIDDSIPLACFNALDTIKGAFAKQLIDVGGSPTEIYDYANYAQYDIAMYAHVKKYNPTKDITGSVLATVISGPSLVFPIANLFIPGKSADGVIKKIDEVLSNVDTYITSQTMRDNIRTIGNNYKNQLKPS